MAKRIDAATLKKLKLALRPLLGLQFKQLSLPVVALKAFEPSQIGTIVGALMDALIPNFPGLDRVGLAKHVGTIGEREGYPDYTHRSGARLELKLLYIDNPEIETKRPPTPREPSARLTQKVTIKNVEASRDAMLLIAYRLEPHSDSAETVSPTIIDFEVLSMIELVESRDARLKEAGGVWFGHYETPVVLSKIGRVKRGLGKVLQINAYGRKQSEGKDYNEDTNFGKLKRIPHPGLQAFLRKYRVSAADRTAKSDAETPLGLPRVD